MHLLSCDSPQVRVGRRMPLGYGERVLPGFRPAPAGPAAVLAVVTRPAGDDANFGEAVQALLDGQATPETRRELDGQAPAS